MTLPSIDSRLQRVLSRQAKAADAARWDRHRIDDELEAFEDVIRARPEQVSLVGWFVPSPDAHQVAARAVAGSLAAVLS